MARTKAFEISNKSKGQAYLSGMGYKGVLRRGSKYGWKYEDGKTSQSKGGFDTAEEAAYNYDEFLLHYIGPNADTNQALGFLKLKTVLEIREKIRKSERPVNKALKHDKRADKIGATGYRGVSANSSKKKPFKSQIYFNGKYVSIGTFVTAEEAARAYDAFVLSHIGNDAKTNISLGLLPPMGEEPLLKRAPAPVIELEQEDDVLPVPMYRTPEEEREAQRLAALAMADEEEEELEEAIAPAAVHAVPEPTPAPAAPPAKTTELLVMSDADKLRARAEAMLREAAEIEAGDLKRQAATRIDALSEKIKGMQRTMLLFIDCCAEFE
ncbi:AP2/ERF family transcription factor, partial [Herbiconiux daphne]